MTRRLLTDAAVFVALVAAGIVALIAYDSLQAQPPAATSSNLEPEACAPQPCANVQGYRLWISNVQVQGNLMTMDLRFQNSSASTHASPEDLQLIDSTHHSSGLVTGSAQCNTWARHEFSNGATFGPVAVCFKVANASPPFTLRWSPDLGLICCQTDITVTPI
ncbi:MAG: hypothetical protein ACHQ0J_06900 [Candidatus Dormibacterales bacterium]